MKKKKKYKNLENSKKKHQTNKKKLTQLELKELVIKVREILDKEKCYKKIREKDY